VSIIKKLLTFIVVASLTAYLGAVGYLYFSQDKLIFPVRASDTENAADANFEKVLIKTPDGETIFGLHHPSEGGEATIIVFHGNASSAVRQKRRGARLIKDGFGVLLAGYRGYPGSTGKPSEKGLFIDAIAAYDFIQAKREQPVALYGHSLGTGVATYLATQRDVFAMVLEAPFNSVAAVAADRYPWIPVLALIKHDFQSDEHIQKITAPILIMHGDSDDTVPLEYGKKLYAKAPEGTEFVIIKGLGHSGFWRFGSEDRAIEFFNNALSTK
jgi:fermentation-respiration switch protein FrsA (DUF1100 family)